VISAIASHILTLPGWLALLVVFALPAFVHALAWPPVLLLFGGGVLYTIGALVYARRWPNPFPRVFGFHEVFHLFVIAAALAHFVAIAAFVVPRG